MSLSKAYGKRSFGLYNYGFRDPLLPVTIPVQILVYDRNGTFKRMYQSGSCDVFNLTFKHTETGCGEFSIEFGGFVNIVESDKIKVRLFSSQEIFYSGVVKKVPEQGASIQRYQYSGLGLNDYLTRINGESLNYANKTVEYIIMDLLDNKIIPKQPIITKSLFKLSFPAITITSLVSNFAQIKDVLDAIKKICDSTRVIYVYGIDEAGDFFFRPRSEDLMTTLIQGKTGKYGIPSYEPETSDEPRTKLFVLRDDGTYYGVYSSTEDNDIFEEKIKGPQISDTDLDLWAQGVLADKQRRSISASIEWQIEEYKPLLLVADGRIRILSLIPPVNQVTITGTALGDGLLGDGLLSGTDYDEFYERDDTLDVKEVSYEISAEKAIRKIVLGALPLRLEKVIADIDQRITDLNISLGG